MLHQLYLLDQIQVCLSSQLRIPLVLQKHEESVQPIEMILTYLFVCILYAAHTASCDRSCTPSQRASPCFSENLVSLIHSEPSAWWSARGPAVCSRAPASSSVSFWAIVILSFFCCFWLVVRPYNQSWYLVRKTWAQLLSGLTFGDPDGIAARLEVLEKTFWQSWLPKQGLTSSSERCFGSDLSFPPSCIHRCAFSASSSLI